MKLLFYFSHFISSFEDFIVNFKWKEVMNFSFHVYFFPRRFFCFVLLDCFFHLPQLKLILFILFYILEWNFQFYCGCHYRESRVKLRWHGWEKAISGTFHSLFKLNSKSRNPPPNFGLINSVNPHHPYTCNSKKIPFWIIYYQITQGHI